jgi:hypothetical protein
MVWAGVVALGWALFTSSCARPVAPTGGPRDVIPPMITSTWPEPFEVIEPTRDPVKIVFNERISERPTEGSLDNAVSVSPETGEHQVKHTRSGLEVEVFGGFQPNLVYRVRILPTVKDMFNNTIDGPFELVFSTGADYEENVVAGVVMDRILGEPAEGVRVEARAEGLEDAPIHVATSDSAGVFALRYLPSGPYDLTFFQDLNRNTDPDYTELQGTLGNLELGVGPTMGDTVILREVMVLRPDTLPARVIGVVATDSLTVRVSLDDFLDAEASLDQIQLQISELVEEEVVGEPLTLDRLLWPRQVDSIRVVRDSIAQVERRIAMVDSLQVVADSMGQVLVAMEAAGDSVGVDTIAPALERIRVRMEPPEPQQEDPQEDPTGLEAPPPILPKREFFVLLANPLVTDRLFQITVAGVTNINGLADGGGELSFTWEAPDTEPEEDPDSTALVPDTLGVPPDTAGVPPDTSRARIPVGAFRRGRALRRLPLPLP